VTPAKKTAAKKAAAKPAKKTAAKKTTAKKTAEVEPKADATEDEVTGVTFTEGVANEAKLIGEEHILHSVSTAALNPAFYTDPEA